MKQHVGAAGTTFRYPDNFTPTRPGGRRRGRGTAAPDADWSTSDRQLDMALETLGFETADTIDITEASGQRRSGDAIPSDPQLIEIDVTTGPKETAVVLVEREGVLAWEFPQTPHLRSRRARGDTTPQQISFRIPLSGRAATRRRGALSWDSGIASWVKAKVLKFAARLTIAGAKRILERHVKPGLVIMDDTPFEKWGRVHDFSELDIEEADDRPILLFVHGTFSSTSGSYGALGQSDWGRDLLKACKQRYSKIVGFDHPTLSATPAENALELLRLIEERNWTNAPQFDAVAFSRGGMVLRCLIEMVLPGSKLRRVHPSARFNNVSFVGATNGGTELASPGNWHELLDVYTNLVLAGTRLASLVPGLSPAVLTVGEGFEAITTFVKHLATEGIDAEGVPGLAAMDPKGSFVGQLNATSPGQPERGEIVYNAVVSDFSTSHFQYGLSKELPRKMTLAAADRLMDQLMGQSNDLVVNTRSMTTIDAPDSGLLKDVLDFGPSSGVYHTIYFSQEVVGKALWKWLGLPGQPASHRRARSGAQQAAAIPQLAAEFRSLDALEEGRKPITPAERKAARKPELRVDIVWDDITRADGDVYSVGHYRGITPQRAELAIDRAVSGLLAETKVESSRLNRARHTSSEGVLLLTEMTKRNLLRGELGDIQLFPWRVSDSEESSKKRAGTEDEKAAAICGMGYPGSFNADGLRLLHQNLCWTVLRLPGKTQLCTVLIGSGEGGLTQKTALQMLLLGFSDVLPDADVRSLKSVKIVERDKTRADRLLMHLKSLKAEADLPVKLTGGQRLISGKHGTATEEHALFLFVQALSRSTSRATLSALKSRLLKPGEIADQEQEAVKKLWGKDGKGSENIGLLAEKLLNVGADDNEEKEAPTTVRLSVFRQGRKLLAAVIDLDGATVTERVLNLDPSLLNETGLRMTDPRPSELSELSRLLYGLVVPREFRKVLDKNGPLVMEVDRSTSRIHWEMMSNSTTQAQIDPDFVHDPDNLIGLKRPVSRQLRTTYSPSPAAYRARRRRRLHALVIGDPGDPAKHESLPGARDEALVVARLFQDSTFDNRKIFDTVHVMIGAPLDGGGGSEPSVQPATRVDVLSTLMNHPIDIIHYAGHGDFDQENPEESGWLFKDGLLTAGAIARLDQAPPMIVANACLTSRLSQSGHHGAEAARYGSEADLLPSLADEFFRKGVLNYIGTAWEIDDEGAIEFAKSFYGKFFSRTGQQSEPFCNLGDALTSARRQLHARQSRYDALWAAYQHYGDVNFTLQDLGFTQDDGD